MLKQKLEQTRSSGLIFYRQLEDLKHWNNLFFSWNHLTNHYIYIQLKMSVSRYISMLLSEIYILSKNLINDWQKIINYLDKKVLITVICIYCTFYTICACILWYTLYILYNMCTISILYILYNIHNYITYWVQYVILCNHIHIINLVLQWWVNTRNVILKCTNLFMFLND